jgi:uncharacterized protein (DUF58 family)
MIVKKLYFTGLLTFLCISCQSHNDKPKAEVFKNIINKGNVQLGNVAEANFYIKNVGSGELYIKDIIPDCYCTTPAWSKKPILSSDSTKITVIVKKQYIGIFQQVVKVICNTDEKIILLVVRGKFVNDEKKGNLYSGRAVFQR